MQSARWVGCRAMGVSLPDFKCATSNTLLFVRGLIQNLILKEEKLFKQAHTQDLDRSSNGAHLKHQDSHAVC